MVAGEDATVRWPQPAASASIVTSTARPTSIRPCIPRVMAPPIPAVPRVVTDPFTFPRSITGLSRAPAPRGDASNAIHEADGDVDRGSLAKKIEKHSHSTALGAGLLHDGHQA